MNGVFLRVSEEISAYKTAGVMPRRQYVLSKDRYYNAN